MLMPKVIQFFSASNCHRLFRTFCFAFDFFLISTVRENFQKYFCATEKVFKKLFFRNINFHLGQFEERLLFCFSLSQRDEKWYDIGKASLSQFTLFVAANVSEIFSQKCVVTKHFLINSGSTNCLSKKFLLIITFYGNLMG